MLLIGIKSVLLLLVGATRKSYFPTAKSSPVSKHHSTVQNIKTRTPLMELKVLQLTMNLQLPPFMITLAEITLIMRYWIRNLSIQIQTTSTAIWYRYSWNYSWGEIADAWWIQMCMLYINFCSDAFDHYLLIQLHLIIRYINPLCI